MTTFLPTKRLGWTGLHLTRVGFGTWAIGGGGRAYAWGNQDDAASVAAIRHASSAGKRWDPLRFQPQASGLSAGGGTIPAAGRRVPAVSRRDAGHVREKGNAARTRDQILVEPSSQAEETMR
jgi:hypothetical protein